MTPRRRFDHFVVELSVALGELAPRFSLWLAFQERGFDPIRLEQTALLRFFDEGPLDTYLAEHGLALSHRARTRLRRVLARFDPDRATPEEILERIAGALRTGHSDGR